MLSEVTILSRLNHPNVVRYFAAWIDEGIVVDDDINSESSGNETLSTIPNGDCRPVLPRSSRGLDFISSSNAHIVFGNDPDADTITEEFSQDESSDDEDSDRSSSSSHQQIEPERDGVSGGLPVVEAKTEANFPGQATWTVLYIQMEYCRPEVSCLPLIHTDWSNVSKASSHRGQHTEDTEVCTKSPGRLWKSTELHLTLWVI